MESLTPTGTWRSAECAVAVEYASEVMDEIRREAMRAFYAFPRGGAEIGGVLLGSHEDGKVRIAAHRPLDCEHAFGPSFILSAKDCSRLEALVGESAGGLEPVGWYHSHTRSEIFLSPQDLEIHARYFGEPWQVALVLRPGNMVTRAGFFARGAGGELRTEASPSEFLLPAPAARPMARAAAAAGEAGETAGPAPAPAAQPVAPANPREVEPPAFTGPEPRRRIRWRAAALLAGVAGLCAAAFITRERWMGYLPSPAQSTVSLNAFDQDGTLQIRWEWRARAVRRARAASLEIADGALRQSLAIPLEQLRAGNFSYHRQSARVELRLRLQQPDGSRVEELVTFLGKPPTPDRQREVEELRMELIREKMLNEALRRELQKRPPPRSARPKPEPESKP